MPLPIDPNTKLNFEQRVLYPSKYPVINNPDGTYSTHKMAWGEADGEYRAYPTIVQDPQSGKLMELPDKLAWQWANETGEYRSFKTPDDAEAYSNNGYKASWGAGEGAPRKP